MRILLLGDYSNVHATLAAGLRELGHYVAVASDGDGWKNYPRDIDLRRPSLSRWSSLRYYFELQWKCRKFRGYDVVQLINPVFLPLKGERILPFYQDLRRYNKKVFMGAFGMDHYYVRTCLDCTTFRYSDFNFGNQLRHNSDNEAWIRDWLYGAKGLLNRQIAADCDGIIAGLYEYNASYLSEFPEKLRFIPFPIRVDESPLSVHQPLRFFIGIQKARSAYKGTDIMLRALERVAQRYPDAMEIVRAESVPFEEYVRLFNNSDILLDQLYSYTPAMNALEAMSHGMIVVGGAEPENYAILGDADLKPIVNVQPNEDDVYDQLCLLMDRRDELLQLKADSREYIRRYHDHLKVARQYLDFWGI